MIIPVRCMSCGKVIGDKWESFQKSVKDGKTVKETLDKLGLTRYCCRTVFMTHVDNIEEVLAYQVD